MMMCKLFSKLLLFSFVHTTFAEQLSKDKVMLRVTDVDYIKGYFRMGQWNKPRPLVSV